MSFFLWTFLTLRSKSAKILRSTSSCFVSFYPRGTPGNSCDSINKLSSKVLDVVYEEHLSTRLTLTLMSLMCLSHLVLSIEHVRTAFSFEYHPSRSISISILVGPCLTKKKVLTFFFTDITCFFGASRIGC